MNTPKSSDCDVRYLDLARLFWRMWMKHARASAFQGTLGAWPTTTAPTSVRPRNMPATRYLEQLAELSAPETREFVHALRRASGLLHWTRTYSREQIASEFLEKYCWAAIAGRNGPVEAKGLHAAVMIIGPRTEYPRHRHDNPEVYLTLAGRAHWTIGDQETKIVEPGTLITIDRNAWHGIRTLDEPMLVSGIAPLDEIRPSTIQD